MHRSVRILISLSCLFLCPVLWADEGYVGEDLGTDIYRRIDEGTYRVKKQLIENQLRANASLIDGYIGKTCAPAKWKEKVSCFRPNMDFTSSELDDIALWEFGPIYTHLALNLAPVSTEQISAIRDIIAEYYSDVRKKVKYDQEKIQAIGSIGLFTDGNTDNSSYDLMKDLQDIHNVLFAHDIPYEGTANLGSSSLADLLKNGYQKPKSVLSPSSVTSTGSTQPASTWATSASNSLSGVISLTGANCLVSTDLPNNLDMNFLQDIQSQLSLWNNAWSRVAFSDDAKLPESWVKAWGSPGGAWGGTDTFPCSGTDFFCITISFEKYSQNLLGGGKAATIEKVLDENLKIADSFAGTSLVQASMTKQFFALSLKDLDLPSMIHLGVHILSLPPPILNLAPGKAATTPPQWWYQSPGEKDEFHKILNGVFEENCLQYNRQNSMEDYKTSRAVASTAYTTTDDINGQLNPVACRSGFSRAMDTELRKSYGDSFNDDFFELDAFTRSFSSKIRDDITSLIKQYDAIPQKK